MDSPNYSIEIELQNTSPEEEKWHTQRLVLNSDREKLPTEFINAFYELYGKNPNPNHSNEGTWERLRMDFKPTGWDFYGRCRNGDNDKSYAYFRRIIQHRPIREVKDLMVYLFLCFGTLKRLFRKLLCIHTEEGIENPYCTLCEPLGEV